MDLQLKVRGYRIEAGEVEACLESHPGVAQASVIAHDFAKDDVRLIAFVVTQPRWAMVELGFAELRKQLSALVKKTLPAYMQPSSYVAVRKIPLTPHGKLDRSALVRMLDADVSPLAAPQASESRGVEDLSLIVGEILRCTVSPNDDLFDLGATSLAIIRILSRVNREFQVNILPTDLLDEATINKLSECVRQKTRPAQLVPPIGLS
jgi:syringomycin synthetase protein SyrB1